MKKIKLEINKDGIKMLEPVEEIFSGNIDSGKKSQKSGGKEDQYEEDSFFEEYGDEDEESERDFSYHGIVKNQRKSRIRHRIVTVVLFIIMAIIAILMLLLLRHYNSYEEVKSYRSKGASSYKYMVFRDALLKYGNDGAILTDYNQNVIWNQGYEMTSPRASVNGSYLIIYDKKNSRIYLFDRAGEISEIRTNLPVNIAAVSSKGTVCAVMQDELKFRLEVYNKKGETLASGELHMEKSGYPSDVAISSDGKTMVVSTIGYRDGQVLSRLFFYNFGIRGKNSIDNIVAKYEYKDEVIPDIYINSSGRVAAIMNDRIVIYDNAREKNILKPENSIKSVFYNDSYIGFTDISNKNGKASKVVKLYSYLGFKRYEKDISMDYRTIKLMPDNDLVLTDGHSIEMLNIIGIRKLKYTDRSEIFDFIPVKDGKNYLVVRSDSVEEVKLTNNQ